MYLPSTPSIYRNVIFSDWIASVCWSKSAISPVNTFRAVILIVASAFIWVIVASAFGQFCPRSRYRVTNKRNRDIKSDKNDRWTWKMKTDQKIFQNFLSLPENQLLKIFFQKIFISSKDAPWNFRGTFGSQIKNSRSSGGREGWKTPSWTKLSKSRRNY